MKKVCIVRRKWYPWQKNVRRDAEALTRAGFEVDVICCGHSGQKKYEVMNGVNIYRSIMPYNRKYSILVAYDYAMFFLVSFLRLSWFTIKKRYDVIEINTMPDFLVFITWFSRLLGSKVVLYMFEDMPSLFMSSYHASPKHVITRMLSFFEKWSAKYADHVIVSDGDHYKQKLMERGIPENKITLVLNVPDTEIFSKDSISSDSDKDHFRIVIVSTLVKRYGVQTVIKAIPQVTNLIPELLIDIVGDGEYKSELESMTKNLGVERHINFRGMVPYDDIPEIIAKAHVGLAPMSDDVGLPNKLFEYFALGKPAIVSQHPSIINAFGFNGTVRYFKPDDDKDLADKIVELYRNPEKRASMVEHGFHYYDKHKWSETKKKYLNVYEALLKK